MSDQTDDLEKSKLADLLRTGLAIGSTVGALAHQNIVGHNAKNADLHATTEISRPADDVPPASPTAKLPRKSPESKKLKQSDLGIETPKPDNRIAKGAGAPLVGQSTFPGTLIVPTPLNQSETINFAKNGQWSIGLKKADIIDAKSKKVLASLPSPDAGKTPPKGKLRVVHSDEKSPETKHPVHNITDPIQEKLKDLKNRWTEAHKELKDAADEHSKATSSKEDHMWHSPGKKDR
jgi:hypothetical protein